jgi:hypothetical protein
VQPTDHRVRSVFVFLRSTKAARRNERVSQYKRQGLVGNLMKHRLMRIAIALGTVASMAIAGGASVKGW